MPTAPRPFLLLRLKRIEAGHTRLSLANEVGWSVAQISRVEAGRSSPSPELFAALARALSVDVAELIAQAPEIPSRSHAEEVAS